MRRVTGLALLCGWVSLQPGCAKSSDTVSDSEVATSVVSGALNTSSGSVIGYNLPAERRSPFQRFLRGHNPLGTAHAVSWSCSGDMLSPHFAGPGSYSFTPLTCEVTWGAGHVVSSTWSSTFDLEYGPSCDRLHPFIGNQAGGCALTRTTAVGGNTRTISNASNDVYAINHDTNGAGTGWDSTVSPAPSNGGAIVTCATGGCQNGGTLQISGSHLTGTVTVGKHAPTEIWDHTVSTASSGITVTGDGTGRVASGTITVQHNLAKYTADVTLDKVAYGDSACCFPTDGSVTSKIVSGTHVGQSETMSFGPGCGDATLTTSGGVTESITLTHCL
jgi:hypothetical protein